MCVTNTRNHCRRPLKLAPEHIQNLLHKGEETPSTASTSDEKVARPAAADSVAISGSIIDPPDDDDDNDNTSEPTLPLRKDSAIAPSVVVSEKFRSPSDVSSTDSTEECSSDSSSSILLLRSDTPPGGGGSTRGCLKISSQSQSIARTYHPGLENHPKKSVGWDTLEIMTYNNILGDNPGEFHLFA